MTAHTHIHICRHCVSLYPGDRHPESPSLISSHVLSLVCLLSHVQSVSNTQSLCRVSGASPFLRPIWRIQKLSKPNEGRTCFYMDSRTRYRTIRQMKAPPSSVPLLYDAHIKFYMVKTAPDKKCYSAIFRGNKVSERISS